MIGWGVIIDIFFITPKCRPLFFLFCILLHCRHTRSVNINLSESLLVWFFSIKILFNAIYYYFSFRNVPIKNFNEIANCLNLKFATHVPVLQLLIFLVSIPLQIFESVLQDAMCTMYILILTSKYDLIKYKHYGNYGKVVSLERNFCKKKYSSC